MILSELPGRLQVMRTVVAFEPTLANPLMLQSNCFDLFDMVSETRAEQTSSQEGEPL